MASDHARRDSGGSVRPARAPAVGSNPTLRRFGGLAFLRRFAHTIGSGSIDCCRITSINLLRGNHMIKRLAALVSAAALTAGGSASGYSCAGRCAASAADPGGSGKFGDADG